MRKGIAVFLTLSLLLALVAPLPKAEAAAQTEREAYIQQVLPGYLGAANITGEIVRYTDEMSINDAADETATLTFIIVDGCFVGYLNVYYCNSAFHSVFTEMTHEGLEQIIRTCEPFFLKYVENDVLLVSESEVITLYNRYSERYSGPMASVTNSYSMHVLHEAEGNGPMRISGYVNVPGVYTGNSLLTWAACVASVVNYYDSTYYDEVGVHNSLVYRYGTNPYCSDLWIGRGYQDLGGFNCTHASSTDFDTLQEEIGIYNRPVLFQFSDDSVVVCKYFAEGSNGIFYLGFMDPYSSSNMGTTYSEYTFPSGLTYPSLTSGGQPQTLARVHYKG